MNRSVVTPHRTAWRRRHRATARWLAGREGLRGSGRGGTRGRGATATGWAAAVAPRQPAQHTVGAPDRPGRPVAARPEATPVVIPPQLALGLCLTRLPRLPARRLARHRLPRRGGRQRTPGGLPRLRLPPRGPFAPQPPHLPLASRRHAPPPH